MATCPSLDRSIGVIESRERTELRRRASSPPCSPSAMTRSVSSPATEPSTPSRALRSSAEATTCAQPGGVRTTTRLRRTLDRDHPLAHHAAQVIERRGRERRGDAASTMRRAPCSSRTLMVPSSWRSRVTVACVAAIPSSTQTRHDLGGGRNHVAIDQLADAVLTLCLGHGLPLTSGSGLW